MNQKTQHQEGRSSLGLVSTLFLSSHIFYWRAWGKFHLTTKVAIVMSFVETRPILKSGAVSARENACTDTISHSHISRKETGNSEELDKTLLPLERSKGRASYRTEKSDTLLSRRISDCPQSISLSHILLRIVQNKSTNTGTGAEGKQNWQYERSSSPSFFLKYQQEIREWILHGFARWQSAYVHNLPIPFNSPKRGLSDVPEQTLNYSSLGTPCLPLTILI